jgi:hypothetical protein
MTRKKNKSKTITTVVVQPMVSNPNKTNKNKKSRRKRGSRRGLRKLRPSERSFFKMASLMPDIFGPFRQPRFGSSARTGLGYDITDFQITGSATNTVQGVQGSSYYNGGPMQSFAVATTTTAFGAGSGVPNSVQFPNVVQIADCNMTAECLVAYYTGNPLNVQGEIIVGASIPISTTSNYSAMYLYPGTQRFPVAELINKPIRISLRKLSEIADEFVPPGNGNADVDEPFLFASGLPVGGTLSVVCFRTWEYRSTTSTGNVVPYERVGENFSGDLLSYQDARADIGSRDSTVTDAVPTDSGEMLTNYLGFGGALSGAGAVAGIAGLARKSFGNAHRSGNQMGIEHPMASPMERYLRHIYPEGDDAMY